jgi:hypothetical protein
MYERDRVENRAHHLAIDRLGVSHLGRGEEQVRRVVVQLLRVVSQEHLAGGAEQMAVAA